MTLKRVSAKYGGLLLGGLYGLLMRILFGLDFNGKFSDLFSITFVWILPILIGLAPLLVSSNEDLLKRRILFFRPVVSVLAFFIFCYWMGYEDILCILIISAPFLLIAGFSGLLFGKAIFRYRKRNGVLFSILLLPIAFGLAEPQIPVPSSIYESKSTILVQSNKSNIWNHIVRVDYIKDDEYPMGFFNWVGVPRPLYAELTHDTLNGLRYGHFDTGLQFKEKIIACNKDSAITFDIQIIPSKSKQSIFERHMLSGHHFKFLQATYSMTTVKHNQTELSLTTQYQLNTNLNFYGKLWGELLLNDFQERLIQVIKLRCEKSSNSSKREL
jgi:hypothetical protein